MKGNVTVYKTRGPSSPLRFSVSTAKQGQYKCLALCDHAVSSSTGQDNQSKVPQSACFVVPAAADGGGGRVISTNKD